MAARFRCSLFHCSCSYLRVDDEDASAEAAATATGADDDDDDDELGGRAADEATIESIFKFVFMTIEEKEG